MHDQVYPNFASNIQSTIKLHSCKQAVFAAKLIVNCTYTIADFSIVCPKDTNK